MKVAYQPAEEDVANVPGFADMPSKQVQCPPMSGLQHDESYAMYETLSSVMAWHDLRGEIGRSRVSGFVDVLGSDHHVVLFTRPMVRI